MRLIIAAVAGVVLAAAVPAVADQAEVHQRLLEIRKGTEVKYKDTMTYYIGPEITDDGTPNHTYETAEIFDVPYSDEDYPDLPATWGYITRREYDCQQQLMWVRRTGMIQLDSISERDEKDLEPAKRSEIVTDDGQAYFAHACGK